MNMKIESICIQNYKSLQKTEVTALPDMAVFIGRNGSGKTAFFDVFAFLRDCLHGNVTSALAKRGGYDEVVSRGHSGEDISFVLQCRPSTEDTWMTYELTIGPHEKKRAIVKTEVLYMRRGEKGTPWKILAFQNGVGVAASGADIRLTDQKPQTLDSPDILAIKGLGQFKEFEAIAALRRLIEDWYVPDFRLDAARYRQKADGSAQLTRSGDNLAVVAKYLYDHFPRAFQTILEKMRSHVPGLEKVEAQETQDGYIVLRFHDGKFKNPFSAKSVSDGTIQLFLYLVLLHDPQRHTLLCVEEPEKQLYPELLHELAEEFFKYALDGQVFISTHSPDFLNAVPLDRIYCLVKKNGYTEIHRAIDQPLVKSLYEADDVPGALWREGLLM